MFKCCKSSLTYTTQGELYDFVLKFKTKIAEKEVGASVSAFTVTAVYPKSAVRR